jgi:hypothetical protein
VTTPDEKSAVLLAWNCPPSIRPAQPVRGANPTWLTTCGEPRSIVTTSPSGVGPSKNVFRFPSVAMATVSPSFWYDPAVPPVVPVRRV